ncbi:MAG: hypothetical protein EXR97_00475 [Nitrospiraceae bacterium]|nr:hypothetical protein [Nitrospiraceae bacterium]MSR23951.1 hypothetical protein [Nitrospiraceae bacterium]
MPIISFAFGVILLLAGCAGTGEVIPLKIQALPSVRSINQNFQDIKVVVEPFEEVSEAGHLGVRTHLGGGETIFAVQGGKLGDAVAQVVADNLKSMGFQIWMKRPAAQELPDKPDITVTGQVQQLSVQARSRFFSTKLTAKVKVMIRVANASDRSTVRLNLEGSREDAVFWFKPGEAQELVNRMLKENLDKLLADVRVQDRALLTK